MLVHVDELVAAWRPIEKWYEENPPRVDTAPSPGATTADVWRLETVIDQSLSEELLHSLTRHNGAPERTWPEGSLFSTWTIERYYEEYCSTLEADPWRAEIPNDDPRLRSQYWNKWIIPFADTHLGEEHFLTVLAVDSFPGAEGKTGQIVVIDAADDEIHYHCGSLAEFFRQQYQLFERASWEPPWACPYWSDDKDVIVVDDPS